MRLIGDFTMVTKETIRHWNDIFKLPKEGKCQPGFLDPTKMPSKSEDIKKKKKKEWGHNKDIFKQVKIKYTWRKLNTE